MHSGIFINAKQYYHFYFKNDNLLKIKYRYIIIYSGDMNERDKISVQYQGYLENDEYLLPIWNGHVYQACKRNDGDAQDQCRSDPSCHDQ